jgi:hypothetical protein
MAAYLTVDEFKMRARLPPEYVDNVETCSRGFVQLTLELESSYIDGLLAKRYAVPFDPNLPAPLCVQRWLVDLVSLQVWLRRGLDATQMDADIYVAAAEQARKDLAEAAKDGFWELPLRVDTSMNEVNGIKRPKVHSYSETSPFLGQRIQRTRGREEDGNGRGTRR